MTNRHSLRARFSGFGMSIGAARVLHTPAVASRPKPLALLKMTLRRGCFGLLALAAGCSGAAGEKKPGAGDANPAIPVTAAMAVRRPTVVELRVFGTVQANQVVAVRSQVTGVLTKVHFKEGADVHENDLLFTMDTRPFQAALDQAEGVLARDKAQLVSVQAESSRQAGLLKKGISSQDVYEQARAAADALAASIKADQAAIDNAKVQLEYCTIRSPIDGRAGELAVHLGNLVKANDVILITINQVRPIQVSFAAPEQEGGEIRKQMAAGKMETRAVIPGHEDQPETGQLTFVDNAVDPGTGTIHLKATFANAGLRLWPGQFVNVTLALSRIPDAVLIPSNAVQTGQKGNYVFVIRQDRTVEDRMVRLGQTAGKEVVVAQGIEPGEEVVTDGQLRLVPGAAVEIQEP
jgi:membrane fusion protein, multidrug efflux system